MLIKPYRDRSDDLEQLTALAARSDCAPRTREQIDVEMRKIRAGQKGERDAAYAIDFEFASPDDWAVIHDLRLEWQGRVAQIDHLMINRLLDVWLCESKHFSDGVAINEHGEFTAFFAGRPRGIESPIEQNHRHRKVLDSVFGSSVLPLPNRLGIDMRPGIRSLVLVSPQARISRPKQTFPGLETIVKSDQLRATINRAANGMSTMDTLFAATKIIGSQTLSDFANKLAALHRPARFDWAGRFGLPEEQPPRAPPVLASPREPKPLHASVMRHEAAPIASTSVVARADPPKANGQDNFDGERLSTSKLAARLGMPNARILLERLAAEGLLVKQGDGHRLTDKGVSAGGAWIEKSRYGPYFVWPADLRLT